jgi:hypothetical protein
MSAVRRSRPGWGSVRTKLAVALLLAALPLAAQPMITTPPGNLTAGTVGTPYSFPIQSTGCGGCTWSIAGTLPAGLNFTTSGSGAGTIYGTPEGCANFWGGTAPCDFGDSTTCGNNTFSPMTCLITVQAGTSPAVSFNVPVNWAPTEAAYLSQQYTYLSQMTQTAGPSAPPIAGGGHLVIANGLYRNSNYDNLGAWNAWIDAMNAAGMHIVNIEVDLECLLSNRATCLALYAGAIAHAHLLGMTVSLNPEYYGTVNGPASCGDAGCPCTGTGCTGNGALGGIAGACYAALGNNAINHTTIGTLYGSGVSDWYTCLVGTTNTNYLGTNVSAYQYMLQAWLTRGDRFVPVHEPTTQAMHWKEGILSGGCNQLPASVNSLACSGQLSAMPGTNNNTCPQDWIAYFLQPFFMAAAGWSVRSGVQYGVTVDYPEMTGGSSSYAQVFSNTLTGAGYPAVNMGMDLYSFEPPRQTLIASTISMFRGGLGGPVHSVFDEEFGPEAWTFAPTTLPFPYPPPTGEACAIVGLQSCTWNGFNQSFFASILSFLAGQGVTDASLYGTEMLGACAPTHPDNGQTINTFIPATTAMLNHQYSLASAGMSAILSSWNRTNVRGCSLVGGSLIP